MTPVTMQFANAEQNIQVLQVELNRAGLADDARRLNGVEVRCAHTARAAFEIVNGLRLINGHTPKVVQDVKAWTIKKLTDAMQSPAVQSPTA